MCMTLDSVPHARKEIFHSELIDKTDISHSDNLLIPKGINTLQNLHFPCLGEPNK